MLKEIQRFPRTVRAALPTRRKFCELPLVGPLFTLIKQVSHPAIAEDVYGHTLLLDPLDSLNLSCGACFERSELSLVERIVSPGAVVVDGGANIGLYTLCFAKLVGSNGRVFAFEPSPENTDLLRTNIRRNGYSGRVEVFEVGLWSDGARGKLALSKDNRGDHRVNYDKAHRKQVPVSLVSLDSVVDEEVVDFVKLDIQGAEGHAFRGMERTLRRSSNVVVMFEFWPDGLRESGEEPVKVLEQVTNLGFQTFALTQKGGLSLVTSKEIMDMTKERARGYSVNVFAARWDLRSLLSLQESKKS